MTGNKKTRRQQTPPGAERPALSDAPQAPTVLSTTGPGQGSQPSPGSSADSDQSSASAKEPIEQVRERVQRVLDNLTDRERHTRDRLKALDRSLQPLLEKVQKIRDQSDLGAAALTALRREAETHAVATTERLHALVEVTRRTSMRCDEFLKSLARRFRRFEALTGRQVASLKDATFDAIKQVNDLGESILKWVERREEQYFGTGAATGSTELPSLPARDREQPAEGLPHDRQEDGA